MIPFSCKPSSSINMILTTVRASFALVFLFLAISFFAPLCADSVANSDHFNHYAYVGPNETVVAGEATKLLVPAQDLTNLSKLFSRQVMPNEVVQLVRFSRVSSIHEQGHPKSDFESLYRLF